MATNIPPDLLPSRRYDSVYPLDHRLRSSSTHHPLQGNAKRNATLRSSRLQPEEIHRLGTAYNGYTANLKGDLGFLLMTGARSAVVTNWNPAWIQADHLTIARNTVGIKKEQVILLSPLAKDLLPRVPPVGRRNYAELVSMPA